jgi:hypothetical protein
VSRHSQTRRTSDPDDLDELCAQQVAVAARHEAAVVQTVLAIVSAEAVCALQSRALHSELMVQAEHAGTEISIALCAS